jgi:hypothetical protein
MDRGDHDARAARINGMLEQLRLHTDDLHELAKQAADRSWESVRAVRSRMNEVRAQHDSRPTDVPPENDGSSKLE